MKRIFYADDDFEDVEIFTEAVNALVDNVDIVPSATCEELLDNLEHRVPPRPDFVFLDLNMPKKSGQICLQDIRRNPMLEGLRIIILSTSKSNSDIDSTFDDGANYFISKPTSLKGYKDVLTKVFAMPYRHKPTRENYVIN